MLVKVPGESRVERPSRTGGRGAGVAEYATEDHVNKS